MGTRQPVKRHPVCGDFGGRTKSGTPCQFKVRPGHRCGAHNDAAEKERRETKQAFLAHYEERPALTRAAVKAGVNRVTIWKWRHEDPEFGAAVDAIEATADDVKLRMVEDSMFNRIVDGDAAAAETIFFLVNRGRGRWRHVQHIEYRNLSLEAFVLGLPSQMVRELALLPEDERQTQIIQMAREAGIPEAKMLAS